MNRRHLLSALAGAGAAGLAGCVSADSVPAAISDHGTAPEVTDPEDVDAPTGDYVAGNANFGLALLGRLADESPNENRFISPYSIGVALAMTSAGARGQTREDLIETMRFPAAGEDLHRMCAALRSDLPVGESEDESSADEDETSFTLADANALWGQEGYPFREDFSETLKRYYGAGLGRVNFEEKPNAARKAINEWVAQRTREKIPELFPEGTVDAATRLVLANAVYFRANWADTFDEDDTEPETFTALGGATGEVPMMYQEDQFPFAEVDGTKVLELPYAGGDTDMVLLMPPRDRFREFERSLDAAALDRLLGATERQGVKVGLPRFEFRSNLRLGEQLKAMGMTTAFTREANFDGIAEGDVDADLKLGAVLHEAYVRVDEEGTEAAAATGVEVEYTSATVTSAEFVADRPFLFLIRHRPTGAPLFLGRMADAIGG